MSSHCSSKWGGTSLWQLLGVSSTAETVAAHAQHLCPQQDLQPKGTRKTCFFRRGYPEEATNVVQPKIFLNCISDRAAGKHASGVANHLLQQGCFAIAVIQQTDSQTTGACESWLPPLVHCLPWSSQSLMGWLEEQRRQQLGSQWSLQASLGRLQAGCLQAGQEASSPLVWLPTTSIQPCDLSLHLNVPCTLTAYLYWILGCSLGLLAWLPVLGDVWWWRHRFP